jgi:hypothetical protein
LILHSRKMQNLDPPFLWFLEFSLH